MVKTRDHGLWSPTEASLSMAVAAPGPFTFLFAARQSPVVGLGTCCAFCPDSRDACTILLHFHLSVVQIPQFLS